MKRTIQKLTLALAAVWLTGSVTGAYGQDSITYVSGPSFPFQYGVESDDASIDLNQDGTPDFSFQLGYFIGTFGSLRSFDGGAIIGGPIVGGPIVGGPIVGGGAYASYYVSGLGANSTLFQFGNGTILPFGTFIGSLTPTNATWSNPDESTAIATLWIGGNQSGLYGPLAYVGVGYIGVRFHAADGLHYGWIRLRSTPVVEVVDWAYESRPEAPIRAGKIGSNSDSIQFAVNFQGPNGAPSGSVGSFILTGNTLRGELTLAGAFSSADIGGRARARAKVKPIANLGPPLVVRTNYTAFFGDATLSHAEIIHLLRRADSVIIDAGAVVGRIAPIQ